MFFFKVFILSRKSRELSVIGSIKHMKAIVAFAKKGTFVVSENSLMQSVSAVKITAAIVFGCVLT